MILLDANILIDIFTLNPQWQEWSIDALETASSEDEVGVNPIVYAEVVTAYATPVILDEALEALGVNRYTFPYEAAWLAVQAYMDYRRRGGLKRSPLPDFYIGAHAQVKGMKLVTRDTSRYRTYFPDVTLVSPED